MITTVLFWKSVLGWNSFVAGMYGLDKFLAWWFSDSKNKDSGGLYNQRRRRRYWRRISEDFLLLLLFACGPIGAWCGMEGFRHKTKKTAFRRRAIALTIVNPLWLVLYKAIKA